MNYFLIFCILLKTITSENHQVSLKEFDLQNHYDSEVGHERYVRHVQAITESVIEHLLKEVQKKFSNSNNRVSQKQLSRVAQEMTNKMRHLRKKLKRRKNKKTNKLKRGKMSKKRERKPLTFI